MKTLVAVLLLCITLNAGVYQIKVLNDNQPDWSDCPSFMSDIYSLQGLTTNQEKAISLWKWVNSMRVQSAPSSSEWGKNPYEKDVIAQFFTSGNNFCSVVASQMGSLFENYVKSPSRLNSLILHNTEDLWYDNAYHQFDASKSCYSFNKAGAVASRTELTADTGLWFTLCPQRTSDTSGAIYSFSNGVSLSGVAGCYVGSTSQKYNYDGSAYNQFILGVRPYEYFKRTKDPLTTAFDKNYFLVCSSGEWPNDDHQGGSCSATNGEWVTEPDLAKSDWAEAAFDVQGLTQDAAGTPKIHPTAAAADGYVVFNINAYGALTSADITADVVKGATDVTELSFSLNAGKSWTSLGAISGGAYTKHLLDEIYGRRCFLLKLRFRAISSPASVGVNSIKIRAITQINRRTFFTLDRGTNKVWVNLGSQQLERIELRPNTSPTTYTSYIYSKAKFGPGHSYINIGPDTFGIGNVTYKIDAPGDIHRVVMGGNFWRKQSIEPIRFYRSIDNGATWKKFGGDARLGVGQFVETWGYTGDHFAMDTIPDTGIKSVLLKCEIIRYTANNPLDYNGIISLWMAADYKPAASPFRPLEVTFNWTEYRATGTVTRSYVKRVATPAEWTAFDINVAGYRAPKMNYVTVNCAGFNPDGANMTEGYSDGQDVGNAAEAAKVYYDKKNLLSRGLAVNASVAPSSGALSGLTDEYVPFGQLASGGPTWSAGANPELTLDLGASKTVQGITMFEGAPANNTAIEYADSIQIYAGDDQASLVYKGTVVKADVWNWPGDFVPPQHWEDLKYLNTYQLHMDSYDVPFSFGTSMNARYIRLKVFNSKQFLLWELRAWETMAKKSWAGDVFDRSSIIASIDGRPVELSKNMRREADIRVFNNPFASSVVIRAANGDRIKDLKIFNIRGQLVYSSTYGRDGVCSQTWNRADNFGKKVADGNYVMKVNTLKGEATPKINLAR